MGAKYNNPYLLSLSARRREAVLMMIAANKEARSAVEAVKQAWPTGSQISWFRGTALQYGRIIEWRCDWLGPSNLDALVENARTGRRYNIPAGAIYCGDPAFSDGPDLHELARLCEATASEATPQGRPAAAPHGAPDSPDGLEDQER